MIAGGLSLFGLDLFGPGRSIAEADENASFVSSSAAIGEEQEDGLEDAADREVYESFFWAMYPVY